MANSPARASVDVGSVIADTYTIEALIGRGGMGSVFLASHTRLPGKRVAIKLLHVEVTDDDVLARFRREALIASQLDHPNIIRVDDYNVTSDGMPYLVLEYLEGESLAQRLQRGPLPLDEVISIMRMVGSAVAAAHREGIIHRDLKPQNIFLITTEVDGQLALTAKVLDFGISKMRGRDTVKTQESTLLGTPQYMAPEQATGQHAAVDERTDVFALGAIAYEMLTGKPAFSGENIPEVVFKVVYEPPASLAAAAPDLPAEVVAAVEGALQKKQDDRHPTIGAFVEAFTGRPLAQRASLGSLPPGDVAATPTGKRTGQAAYANTVDSGNLAKIATGETVSPHAVTVASQHDERAPAMPPPGSRRPLVIGLALACALAIGAVSYLVTRDGAPAKVAAAGDVAGDAASAVAVDALAAAATDALAVVATDEVQPDALAVDAAVAVAVDAPRERPSGGGATVGRKRDDPYVAEQLAKAHKAYAANNIALALQHCNDVVGRKEASDAQLDEALLLRGTIHCKHKYSIGDLNIDLRMMKSRAARARLRERCAAE